MTFRGTRARVPTTSKPSLWCLRLLGVLCVLIPVVALRSQISMWIVGNIPHAHRKVTRKSCPFNDEGVYMAVSRSPGIRCNLNFNAALCPIDHQGHRRELLRMQRMPDAFRKGE